MSINDGATGRLAMLQNFNKQFRVRSTDFLEIGRVVATKAHTRLMEVMRSLLLIHGLSIFDRHIFGGMQRDDETQLYAQRSVLISEVEEYGMDIPSHIVEIQRMDDLMRLAIDKHTTILHLGLDFTHHYFVQTRDTTFRYAVGDKEQGQAENLPVLNITLKNIDIHGIVANKSFGELFQHEVLKSMFRR
jgi:hypothetical protein